MITCTRCGKENQDHYKFCLGCGNEIKAPAPAPAPASPPTPTVPEGAMANARTMLPSDGGLSPPTAAGPAGPPVPVATPSSKPSGGIPWGDSPKMPSPRVPATAPSTPAAAAPPHPAPATPVAPVPHAAPAGPTPCPNCGHMVNPGFAFCGSCGARISAPPAAAAPAAAPPAPEGAQRTMFMNAPQAAPSTTPRGRLVLIRPDGSEGGTHTLHDGENLVGRGQGPLFDSDAYLSPRHAEFLFTSNGLVVRDLRSLNGVFIKITQEENLQSGDIYRLGQELLRFDAIMPPAPLEDGTEIMGTPNPGFWGRLSVIVGRDVDGSAFPIFGESIVMGRERGDIIFPEDGYVSGTHARIALRETPEGHKAYLADLGSSNGTFMRVRGERVVPSGAFLLMGQQLFRLEYR